MIKFCQPFRDVDEYRSANPNLFKIPFNSKNKYQVRAWNMSEKNDDFYGAGLTEQSPIAGV